MLNRQERCAREAFSLIELVVVIVLLGVLTSLAVPVFQAVMARAEEKTAVASSLAVGRQAVAMASFDGDPSGGPDGSATDQLANSALSANALLIPGTGPTSWLRVGDYDVEIAFKGVTTEVVSVRPAGSALAPQ